MVGARRGSLAAERGDDLRPASEVSVKRLYRENGEVRPGLKKGDHGELVLPAEGARVQGRVVRIVHPSREKSRQG